MLVLPLIHGYLVRGYAGDSATSGHGAKHGADGRAASVTDAAVHVLRAVALRLPWPQYAALLMRYLKARTPCPASLRSCPCRELCFHLHHCWLLYP
jgi:hypothetical protein